MQVCRNDNKIIFNYVEKMLQADCKLYCNIIRLEGDQITGVICIRMYGGVARGTTMNAKTLSRVCVNCLSGFYFLLGD